MPTRYSHHTIPMEKVIQAQTKSCLTKSRNQDEALIYLSKYLKYESGKPFSWFPEEVSKPRHDGENNLALK